VDNQLAAVIVAGVATTGISRVMAYRLYCKTVRWVVDRTDSTEGIEKIEGAGLAELRSNGRLTHVGRNERGRARPTECGPVLTEQKSDEGQVARE